MNSLMQACGTSSGKKVEALLHFGDILNGNTTVIVKSGGTYNQQWNQLLLAITTIGQKRT